MNSDCAESDDGSLALVFRVFFSVMYVQTSDICNDYLFTIHHAICNLDPPETPLFVVEMWFKGAYVHYVCSKTKIVGRPTC